MRLRTYALLSCLPLLGACQMLGSTPEANTSQTRVQGQLLADDSGQLRLQSCDHSQVFVVREGQSNLLYEVAQLGEKGVPLFVDLEGSVSSQNPEKLTASALYRLEREGRGCAGADANERRLVLQAQGNEPFWRLQVQTQGLVLLRPDAEPLALPYVEEQLGENRYYFSSEANGQRLDLWVAPQRCIDSMSGTLYHLSAELRLGDQQYRGCASLGGGRNLQP